ncbi:MAG: response regulator transcription factor [Alphaproteobacteria bacterium]
MRILIVEDEAEIATDVASGLAAAGYVAEICGDGEEGWYRAGTEEFDAAVIDLSLPKLDGLSLVQRLRSEAVDLPIIILTARSAWTQRVDGIDAGADDYLTKPFHMEELLARLGALLRRVSRATTPLIRVGQLEIDTRRMRVFVKGQTVPLTPLEFRLIRYLAHNRGRVISSGEISDHVYGQQEPENNAIEALVARLRRKIGASTITTRRGHGYLLQGDP